ncbi:hypothetical protein NP493_105g04011 [Ridgeia piscesae]|uniref:EF-hand domain-containing protein n=1 Tax=Ridgeia piscesae TaxID=27915 RepID=A0AAD9UHF3_RIDPI|nr:hypothetical protein NP493_105g04011 [Ridgeia piscesae]
MAASIAKVRDACLKRGPAGIKQFSRTFRLYDDNGNKKLDMEEFRTGLRDYGIVLNDGELRELFAALDSDSTGSISFDEFLIALRPPMSKNRRDLIDMAFDKMDKTGDGVITVEDLAQVYDVRQHPKHKSGEWTAKQVLEEFLRTFDVGGVKDNKVTREEFTNYYAGVSASIDKDVYFDLMMRQSWKL